MTITEQQLGPVLSDYHEGQGGLEAAIWMANAIAAPGGNRPAVILAVITGIGMSVITYVSLRSA